MAFLAGGLVWASLLTYLVHGFGFSWYIGLTDGIITCTLLGAACWLINNNLRYYQPGKGSYINIFIWCAGTGAGLYVWLPLDIALCK